MYARPDAMSPSRATVPGCVLHQEVHKIRCPLAPGADLLAADELDRDVVHDEAQLAALRSVARQRLAAGQDELDLGLEDSPAAGGPLEITGTRMGHL